MLFQRFIRILQANRLAEGSPYLSNQEAERLFEEFYQRYAQGKYNKSGTTEGNPQAKNPLFAKEKPYYDALELPFGVGFEEIRTAYRKLAKCYHPDKFQYDADKCRIAEKIMRSLNEAYAYFEKKFGK